MQPKRVVEPELQDAAEVALQPETQPSLGMEMHLAAKLLVGVDVTLVGATLKSPHTTTSRNRSRVSARVSRSRPSQSILSANNGESTVLPFGT
jgi:hypothetical protein